MYTFTFPFYHNRIAFKSKFKQLLSNFEAETQEKLSNLRLAKKSVAYKKTPVTSVSQVF